MPNTNRLFCTVIGLCILHAAPPAVGQDGTQPIPFDAPLPYQVYSTSGGAPSVQLLPPAPGEIVMEPPAAERRSREVAAQPSVSGPARGAGHQGRPCNRCGRHCACCPAPAAHQCHCPCDYPHHWGYPQYFTPEPLGALLHQHFNTQVGNGQAAQLILYYADFVDGPPPLSSRLTAYGARRLRRMVRLLAMSALPLMIQGEVGKKELNHQRRMQVIDELARWSPVPIDPHRVVVVDADVPSLNGVEAIEVYHNLLRQTSLGGGLRQSTGSGGSFGSSGSSSSGSGQSGGR